MQPSSLMPFIPCSCMGRFSEHYRSGTVSINKKLPASRPGKGIEHNRRERCNATTRQGDACRVVITTEGPGRFDATTSTVYVYHDFARVANTEGSKTFTPTSIMLSVL